jgi:hypothetical protein
MKQEIIEFFSELEEHELTLLYSMYVASSKVIMCADSVPNPMKASISNSCGEATSNDGTEYQLKVVLVADKSEWRDKEILEVLSPDTTKTAEAITGLNINDIN